MAYIQTYNLLLYYVHLNEYIYRVVFCDAYKKNVYGDKFQWLIVGMYEQKWWEAADDNLDCTPDQVTINTVKPWC